MLSITYGSSFANSSGSGNSSTISLSIAMANYCVFAVTSDYFADELTLTELC